MMGTESAKSQCLLKSEVIERGICVKCGACVGFCPYFDYHDGRVVVMDDCQVEGGRCIQICPRAELSVPPQKPTERSAAEYGAIGPYQAIMMARTKDGEIKERAQYGGVVSTLIIFALEKGFLKAAVLTDTGENGAPNGKVARNRAGVLNCARSRYSGSATLAALNHALKAEVPELGLVGLPCQMEALERMKRVNREKGPWSELVLLKIGLFCTWALDYRGLNAFLKKEGIEGPVAKFDIPPPPSEIFKVETQNGWRDFSLQDIRPLVQPGCGLCEDMTAEYADISVGTVESDATWNTVLIRTDKGAELCNAAIEERYIETAPLPNQNLEHLKEAAANKRRRGRAAKQEMDGSAE